MFRGIYRRIFVIRRIKGATVSELLIVLAIISMLVALFYPVVQFSRAKAKQNHTEFLDKPKISYDSSRNVLLSKQLNMIIIHIYWLDNHIEKAVSV